MRAFQNIWIGLVVLLAGMNLSAAEPEELTRELPGTYAIPATDSGSINMSITLSKDGHWSWQPQSEKDKTNRQSGTWFVHHQILVLRIEKTEVGEMPEGFAMTWDVRRVTAEGIVLYDLWRKKELTWKRAS